MIEQVHVRRAEGLSTLENKKGKQVDLHPQVMVSVGPSCGAASFSGSPYVSAAKQASQLTLSWR